MLLLLWTVILSSKALAQSGGADMDMEPTVSCMSHISLREGSQIHCQLVSNGYDLADDEDDNEEEDEIAELTACCCERLGKRCELALGDTLSSMKLNVISPITLTARTKRGHLIEKSLDLKTIIKPKSPQIYNVTLKQDQALVHVEIPYNMDYLSEDNLLLQLQLWSEKTNQTKNMTSGALKMGFSQLRGDTLYYVKVRAIPSVDFQGTWSEWSQAYTFHVPTVHALSDKSSGDSFVVTWIIIPVVLALSVMFLILRKTKILAYVWPSIPHPKTTLEQMYGLNTGHLLCHVPEEFSSLNVNSSVSQSARPSCSEKDPALSSAATNETTSCSIQSTYTSMSTSVGTEELDLLSQSSTSEEGQDVTEGLSIEMSSPHLEALEAPRTEHSNTQNKRDNSYVTMSSFAHIRTPRTAGDSAPMKLTVS